MKAESLQIQGLDCAPPLAPKLAPWIRKLIARGSANSELIERYGSPLHIVAGSEFKRNARDLSAPLRDRGLSGGLYFARKANKLPWFVTLANEEGLGVDTASLSEVRETLSLGVDPKKIAVTAIGKGVELVREAVGKGCLIVIDNADELELVRSVAESLDCSARIGLRFSGFEIDGRRVFSRFGFPIIDAGELLSSIGASGKLRIELLHAHLDKYDVAERAGAASQLLALCDYGSRIGIEIPAIDLGGGILIRYLDDAGQWQIFLDSLVAAVKGERQAFTYHSDGLGYVKVGDEVRGQADLYPAWNRISKERFVSAILDHNSGGSPLHKQLSDRGVGLFFEPGRALLDNVGLTLATVTFRKRDTSGNLLVGVAMNRTNLRPFRAEFCSDPILLASGKRKEATEGAYMVGNLCSEGDSIFRRKLQLRFTPEPGDIFCFANTAGYLAHHLEVGTHGDALPRNVLLDSDSLEVVASV